MTYEDYVSDIGFTIVQPTTPLGTGVLRLRGALHRLGVDLDVAITRLPESGRRMRRTLREACRVPRMSTFAIGAIINEAVAHMAPDHAFVNVGVWNGFTLLAGMAGNPDRRCIGVDNFSEFGGPRDAFLGRFVSARSERHEFHDMDYQAYFARVHRGPIGFYIYDGEHSYANQLRGLEVAAPFFAPGCILLVDDTNDEEPRRATLDFVAAQGGAFRVLLDRRTACNGHPTFWNGVILLQRV